MYIIQVDKQKKEVELMSQQQQPMAPGSTILPVGNKPITAIVADAISNTPVPKKETVVIDIENNPSFNKDLLKRKIIHNEEMGDEELDQLINTSYTDILACIFDEQDFRYLDFVSTPRFINSLIRVVSSQSIKYKTRIHINKLIYDYLTYHGSTEKDAYVTTLMTNLASVVNGQMINIMIGLGIPNNMANYIVLSRYSSENEFTNIKRVNFIICTLLIKLFDLVSIDTFYDEQLRAEQMVVDIYSKLFNKITILFEGVMFDRYELTESWVTEPVSEMYSTTTYAVLDILNNMSIENIKLVLRTYTSDHASVFAPKGFQPRMSLRSISNDYDRIVNVINMLIAEQIYVP